MQQLKKKGINLLENQKES